MAVAVFVKWAGVTAERYDRVREIVGWERETAPGGLFHVAAVDEHGLRITDLWDTAEQFQSFMSERLAPVIAEVGLAGAPEIEIIPIHALFTPAFKRI